MLFPVLLLALEPEFELPLSPPPPQAARERTAAVEKALRRVVLFFILFSFCWSGVARRSSHLIPAYRSRRKVKARWRADERQPRIGCIGS